MILRVYKPLDLIRRFAVISKAASTRWAYSQPSVLKECLCSDRFVLKDNWARARTRTERDPGTRLQLSKFTTAIGTTATPAVLPGMQSSDDTLKEWLEPTRARVAVAQMTSTGDQSANFIVCSQLAREAARQGCSMLFLPECCSFIGHAQKEVGLIACKYMHESLCSGLPQCLVMGTKLTLVYALRRQWQLLRSLKGPSCPNIGVWPVRLASGCL